MRLLTAREADVSHGGGEMSVNLMNDGPANRLTNPAGDPQAKIPEFKVCACSMSATT